MSCRSIPKRALRVAEERIDAIADAARGARDTASNAAADSEQVSDERGGMKRVRAPSCVSSRAPARV